MHYIQALLVESLVRVSVGGSRHKVYLGKWNKWLAFLKKKGRRPWLNLVDKSEVLTLLLEIHGLPTVFILIISIPPSEGTSPRLRFSASCT